MPKVHMLDLVTDVSNMAKKAFNSSNKTQLLQIKISMPGELFNNLF